MTPRVVSCIAATQMPKTRETRCTRLPESLRGTSNARAYQRSPASRGGLVPREWLNPLPVRLLELDRGTNLCVLAWTQAKRQPFQ